MQTLQATCTVFTSQLMDYLEIGHGDSVDHVLLGLLDPAEEVIERQHHDPWVLVCPKHCVCLASSWEGGRGARSRRRSKEEEAMTGGGWEKEGGGRMGGGREGRRREDGRGEGRKEEGGC